MAADMKVAMKHCLNILRRTPPSDVNNNLDRLIALRPDLDEELCQRVDTPLEIKTDTTKNKHFVLCDYNRDGDSYRSPWSNEYFPPLEQDEEGLEPSDKLRKLEIEANKVFDIYRGWYFEGGVSSVYMWDLDNDMWDLDNGFAACFCIAKQSKCKAKQSKSDDLIGVWSSVHVFEVSKTQTKDTFEYKLTSTVLVSMPYISKGLGTIDLSGSMTKQASKTFTLKSYGDTKESHLVYMGPMIEDLELGLRNTIDGIYFQKTKEIINGMRVVDSEIKVRDKKLQQLSKQAADGKTKKTLNYGDSKEDK